VDTAKEIESKVNEMNRTTQAPSPITGEPTTNYQTYVPTGAGVGEEPKESGFPWIVGAAVAIGALLMFRKR